MADDWSGDASTAGTAVPGNSFFARIDSDGDRDWFQVELTAGTTYLFTMRGLDTGEGTLADPILRLHSGSGANPVVATNNDSGTGHDAVLIYVATQSGTYFIDAGSFGSTGTGVYTLGMEDELDLPANATTPVTLGIFDAMPNIIDKATDKDWYRVHLEAGVTYVFDLVGAGYRGSLPDGELRLFRETNPDTHATALVKIDDNSGADLDSRIIYTATADGDYYLQAASKTGELGFYWMYTAEAYGANYIDSLIPVHDQWWPPDDYGAETPHWTITWNFMGAPPTYAFGDDTVGFQALDATHRAAVESALSAWGALANITFVYVGDADETAMIRFGSNHGGSHGDAVAGYAYYPDQDPEDFFGSDVYFNNQDGSFGNVTPGSYGYLVMLHEIGHALGLKHSGENGEGDMAPFLPAADDTRLNTVMSYHPDPNTTFEPVTPMLYDIDAIQFLYGVNNLPEGAGGHAGRSTYTFSNSVETLQAIWDPSGVDTFDCSNQTQRVIIDLNEFHMSSIGPKTGGGLALDNVGIANGSIIENAKGGSGADKITGNAAKNILTGNGGNDTLDGGLKADLLRGGAGKDTFVWDKADDSVAGAVQGGSGSDTLLLKGKDLTMDLTVVTVLDDAFLSIEKIDIRGTGNNVLKIGGADVWAMNADHEIFVRANAGDDCRLAGGGWHAVGAATIGGVAYDHYTNDNGASLYWDQLGDAAVILSVT